MSAPLESPEFGTLFVGNTHDDDGPVIDSLVQEVDAPAKPVIEPIPSIALDQPDHPTRLLSGSIRLDPANPYTVFQLLPPDEYRKDFSIVAYSEAASPIPLTEYVWIADTNGKVNTSASGKLRHGVLLTLAAHTGPIYILAYSGLTAAINLDYWSTTK